MKYTPEQLDLAIQKCVDEKEIEHAILIILYELGGGQLRKESRETKILKRLNQFLKHPFSQEDLKISLHFLEQKGLLEKVS